MNNLNLNSLCLIVVAGLTSCLVAAAMILSSTRITAQASPPREDAGAPPLAIRVRPEGLQAMALTKQHAVFSINLTLADGTGSMNKGFFMDRNGLALCPLLYLCMKTPLRFDASDGTVLATPKVRAVFPDRHLALVNRPT